MGGKAVRISSILRAAGITLAAMMAFAAGPALAEWKRAESPHFIVYSQGNEAALRRYVANLEIYDYTLRVRMGLPLNVTPGRKLPIYLVSGRAGLLQINPNTGPDVAGTYFPVGEDIFAAAIQDRENDYLFHEYFHHFSFQLGATSTYPGWLIEGLAEYFMTAEIRPEYVDIGRHNEGRAFVLLNMPWLTLDTLLSKRPGELRRQEDRDSYYPVAWLLTHWFMSNEERAPKLMAYVADIQAGGEPVEAMQRATGLTMSQLRQELRRYMTGRLPVKRYSGDLPRPEITITRVPESANDLLLLAQRLKVGVVNEERAATAALIRRLSARHPNDPFALLQLGHAELHFGDPEAGEAVLTRLLEMEPENVEALQLMATRFIRLAEDRPDDAPALLLRARTYLARAYQADNGQYYTLQLLAETRESREGYPTENDLTTWDLAFGHAPQLSSIRLGYARALMMAAEFDNAIVVLTPLANAPHGGATANAARTLIERARAGQSPFSVEELQTAVDADNRADEPTSTPPSPSGEPVDPADG